MKSYRTKEVATILGYSQPRIVQICRKLKLPMQGNRFSISESDIEAIRGELGKRQPGRPPKTKQNKGIDCEVNCNNERSLKGKSI